jgi:hypothetical protein
MPPAALPGAKLLKKFDQNFLLKIQNRCQVIYFWPPEAKVMGLHKYCISHKI